MIPPWRLLRERVLRPAAKQKTDSEASFTVRCFFILGKHGKEMVCSD
jgi:hypothetical protein